MAMAKEWSEAAKKVEGGENLKVYLRFPVAVDAMGDFDMLFEIVFPSFGEWGKFWDNYSGSEAGDIEDQNADKGVICPDSSVWEIEAVK